jgi:hypothetical protein
MLKVGLWSNKEKSIRHLFQVLITVFCISLKWLKGSEQNLQSFSQVQQSIYASPICLDEWA